MGTLSGKAALVTGSSQGIGREIAVSLALEGFDLALGWHHGEEAIATTAALAEKYGVRVVLVQNIGMVTIAALIGGGGLGTFVFQGIGQTAIDLVLLGAIPIVALAFSAAVLLDALVQRLNRGAA